MLISFFLSGQESLIFLCAVCILIQSFIGWKCFVFLYVWTDLQLFGFYSLFVFSSLSIFDPFNVESHIHLTCLKRCLNCTEPSLSICSCWSLSAEQMTPISCAAIRSFVFLQGQQQEVEFTPNFDWIQSKEIVTLKILVNHMMQNIIQCSRLRLIPVTFWEDKT